MAPQRRQGKERQVDPQFSLSQHVERGGQGSAHHDPGCAACQMGTWHDGRGDVGSLVPCLCGVWCGAREHAVRSEFYNLERREAPRFIRGPSHVLS